MQKKIWPLVKSERIQTCRLFVLKRDFMAFFLIKNSTDLKHIIFSLPEDYPKPPLFTMTILYNNCGIKIHLYKANTKKNSAANGYSNLLPNGTGVISVIWTQTLQILKVRQKTVIINKSITSLLLSSTGCWTIFHSLFLQMEASIQWMLILMSLHNLHVIHGWQLLRGSTWMIG